MFQVSQRSLCVALAVICFGAQYTKAAQPRDVRYQVVASKQEAQKIARTLLSRNQADEVVLMKGQRKDGKILVKQARAAEAVYKSAEEVSSVLDGKKAQREQTAVSAQNSTLKRMMAAVERGEMVAMPVFANGSVGWNNANSEQLFEAAFSKMLSKNGRFDIDIQAPDSSELMTVGGFRKPGKRAPRAFTSRSNNYNSCNSCQTQCEGCNVDLLTHLGDVVTLRAFRQVHWQKDPGIIGWVFFHILPEAAFQNGYVGCDGYRTLLARRTTILIIAGGAAAAGGGGGTMGGVIFIP